MKFCINFRYIRIHTDIVIDIDSKLRETKQSTYTMWTMVYFGGSFLEDSTAKICGKS